MAVLFSLPLPPPPPAPMQGKEIGAPIHSHQGRIRQREGTCTQVPSLRPATGQAGSVRAPVLGAAADGASLCGDVGERNL